MIGVVHDPTGSAIQYFATSYTSARTSKLIEQKDKRHRRDFLGSNYMAYEDEVHQQIVEKGHVESLSPASTVTRERTANIRWSVARGFLKFQESHPNSLEPMCGG